MYFGQYYLSPQHARRIVRFPAVEEVLQMDVRSPDKITHNARPASVTEDHSLLR